MGCGIGLRKQGWIEGLEDLRANEMPSNLPGWLIKWKSKAIDTSLLTNVCFVCSEPWLSKDPYLREPAVSWEKVGINPLL